MLRKNFISVLNYVTRYRKNPRDVEHFVNLITPRKILLSSRSITTPSSRTENPSMNLSYIESVESYFHNYLLDRTECYKSICKINCLKTVNDSDPESLKLLEIMISASSPETTVQDELEKSFKSELNTFTVKEICKAIYFLSQLGISDNQIFCRTLLNIFEHELQTRKFSKEEYLKMLYVIHTTCTFKRSYLGFLKIKSCVKLSCKLHQLNPQQAVVLFYCLNQNLSKFEYKFQILSQVNDMIPQLNSDELGIVALGLLRSNIKTNHNNIGSSIMKKILQEIENIHPCTLFVLSKVLKTFFLSSYAQELLDFQEQMIPHLAKVQPKTLINLAFIGNDVNVLNLSFWESAKNFFKKKIQDLNDSDLSRILRIQVYHNNYDEEFLNLIVKNLENKDTVLKEDLLLCLSYLTHFKVFPKKLLDLVLTDDFAPSLTKRNMPQFLKFNLWYLNCCLELDKPEYPSKSFDNVSRAKFYKNVYYGLNSSEVQRFNTFFYLAKEVLIKLFGENMVFKTNCVPYFDFGCVMRFDKDLNATPIPEEYKLLKNYYAQKALKDDHFWLFIMFCSKKDFLWNSDIICLPRQTQFRHLKLIGFTPVVIKREVFYEQLKIQKKEVYLKEIINECLKQLKSEEMLQN